MNPHHFLFAAHFLSRTAFVDEAGPAHQRKTPGPAFTQAAGTGLCVICGQDS
jgi:hypothetical protein